MMEEQRLSTSDIAGASSVPDEAPAEDTAPAAGAVPRAVDAQPAGEVPPAGEGEERRLRAVSDDGQPTAHEGDERASGRTPLLPTEQTDSLRLRWEEIQTGFVDEPRRSVEAADALVADVMQRLATQFSNERQGLEQHWDRGDDVSTEDLRVALTRYRSFFDRLLAA